MAHGTHSKRGLRLVQRPTGVIAPMVAARTPRPHAAAIAADRTPRLRLRVVVTLEAVPRTTTAAPTTGVDGLKPVMKAAVCLVTLTEIPAGFPVTNR